LLKAGADIEKIHAWSGKQVKNLKANLFSTVSDGSLVIGVGNIGGDGFYILNELK
jgi:NAD(P)H-hydrate repair Nnr-like enzyme with NAD(P)H-hydrate epimerase domain